MKTKKPVPGQMEKIHELGTPWPEDQEPSTELGQVEDLPQPENWDRLLMEKKRKVEEEFLTRWPSGHIHRTR